MYQSDQLFISLVGQFYGVLRGMGAGGGGGGGGRGQLALGVRPKERQIDPANLRKLGRSCS